MMTSYGVPEKKNMHKNRHIVSWTAEEDEILRQQIRIRGTESWKDIASNFKNKTSRQCRRRWYAYLNSDSKKGGWSEEEDHLLCEAHKLYGNRWTEIAKVVSGRTDNAVKNRFTTLCKKRAKCEVRMKENNNNLIILRHSEVMTTNRCSTSQQPLPTQLEVVRNIGEISTLYRSNPELKEMPNSNFQSGIDSSRPPLVALDTNNLIITSTKKPGAFLKKDDPRITALMRQAELLSSLASKINIECSEKILEDAWKEVQDFLQQSKENEKTSNTFEDVDILFEDFKDLIEDLKKGNLQLLAESSNNKENWLTQRDFELHKESQRGCGRTSVSHHLHPVSDEMEQPKTCFFGRISNSGLKNQEDSWTRGEYTNGCSGESIEVEVPRRSSCENLKGEVTGFSGECNPEFCSPQQSVPLVRTYSDGIPTPEFSASEKRFLLRTLGVFSPSPPPKAVSPPPQPPQMATIPCRRALLHHF